jgi:gentisate 1,2-dioxygenase
MPLGPDELRARRLAYHHRLRGLQLREGFSYDDDGEFVSRPYWPTEPRNRVRPHLWRWSEVRAAVEEAGEMVALGRGARAYDRRVLALTNPGLEGEFALTGTHFGDIQLIRPGEGAPCHRHTPCATRFFFEGQGGWTNVGGEKVHVAPGDIVFTGQFPWHDHGNEGPDDLLFLDVLDIPILLHLAASHWEFDYAPVTGSVDNVHQPATVTDQPIEPFLERDLEPRFATAWRRKPEDFAHFPYRRVRRSLEAHRHEVGSPWDGVLLEATSLRGGPAGPTMSIYSQLLRPGERTLCHRHTSSTIYVGVEGEGICLIDGVEHRWGPRDIFVVPSWAWHEHHNPTGQDAVLHSLSDAALVSRLRLWREQRRREDGQIEDSSWTDLPYGDRGAGRLW